MEVRVGQLGSWPSSVAVLLRQSVRRRSTITQALLHTGGAVVLAPEMRDGMDGRREGRPFALAIAGKSGTLKHSQSNAAKWSGVMKSRAARPQKPRPAPTNPRKSTSRPPIHDLTAPAFYRPRTKHRSIAVRRD